MHGWIDTHCHLDAPEFSQDIDTVRARAFKENVVRCVIPAVEAPSFEAARSLAHRLGDAYALGIHPLFVERAGDDALEQLATALDEHHHVRPDARLVAVGEIGLD